MTRLLIVLSLLFLAGGLVSAQTPPSTTATLAPRQQIDAEATRILAGYTATAAAFPLAPEETESFAATAFGLGLCSMLIVAIPLAFGLWRMNRRA